MPSSTTMAASVSDSLLRCSAVCELLLTVLSAAATHGRLPFDQPTKVTATDQRSKRLSFLTNKAFDATKLLSTVNAIPALDQLLSAATDNTLAATLDAIDPLIIPLLDWTLHHPDVYIRQLEREERFSAVPTDQQFAVCMPSWDAKFLRARREQAASRGVTEEEAVSFQFHGSQSHNWHSILRTGLKNLSNTQWMGSPIAAHTTQHGAQHRAATPSCRVCSITHTLCCSASMGTVVQLVRVMALASTSRPIRARHWLTLPSHRGRELLLCPAATSSRCVKWSMWTALSRSSSYRRRRESVCDSYSPYPRAALAAWRWQRSSWRVTCHST